MQREMGFLLAPIHARLFFLKPSTAIIENGGRYRLAKQSLKTFHHEVELTVFDRGKQGKRHFPQSKGVLTMSQGYGIGIGYDNAWTARKEAKGPPENPWSIAKRVSILRRPLFSFYFQRPSH
jgi:2-keto-4-pentenoate hydratase/2-oxohepta-3-ene-1,7-dioic acid hydratase in catechol pathway